MYVSVLKNELFTMKDPLSHSVVVDLALGQYVKTTWICYLSNKYYIIHIYVQILQNARTYAYNEKVIFIIAVYYDWQWTRTVPYPIAVSKM